MLLFCLATFAFYKVQGTNKEIRVMELVSLPGNATEMPDFLLVNGTFFARDCAKPIEKHSMEW